MQLKSLMNEKVFDILTNVCDLSISTYCVVLSKHK